MNINFWNGNKSKVRQQHELAVLNEIKKCIGSHWSITHNTTDYSRAEDEAAIFQLGADLLTSVAGNIKLSRYTQYSIPQPICGNMLGCRLLVINRANSNLFKEIADRDLKRKIAGIPATWADAQLLRCNGFSVLEKGSLADMFEMLRQGLCDYIPLGINEVQSLFDSHSHDEDTLSIENSIMLYYALPIVFYVHPKNAKLKESIAFGIELIQQNGMLHQLYEQHYGTTIRLMKPENRRLFQLINPNLGQCLANAKPTYFQL